MSGLDLALYIIASLLFLLHLSIWAILWRRRNEPALRSRSPWLTAVACGAQAILTYTYLLSGPLTDAGVSCAVWLWVLAFVWPVWSVAILLRSMRLWWAWEVQRGAIRETELRRQTRVASLLASCQSLTRQSHQTESKRQSETALAQGGAPTWTGLDQIKEESRVSMGTGSMITGAELSSTAAIAAERQRVVAARTWTRARWLLLVTLVSGLIVSGLTVPVQLNTTRYQLTWTPTARTSCPAGLGWELLPVYGVCLLFWLISTPLVYMRLSKLPRDFSARIELAWYAGITALELLIALSAGVVTTEADFDEHAMQPIPYIIIGWHTLCLGLAMLFTILRPALIVNRANSRAAKTLAALHAATASQKPHASGPTSLSPRVSHESNFSNDGRHLASLSPQPPRIQRNTRPALSRLTAAFSHMHPASGSTSQQNHQISTAGFERFLHSLDNRRELKLFRDFSVRDFSVENILFYEHCHRLHRLLASPDGIDLMLLTGETQEIAYLFLQPGAQYEVNISGATRNELLQAAQRGAFGVHELEKAKREIARLMYQNTYPRFIRWRKEMGLPIDDEESINNY
jgi:hypothetical protein